MIWLRSTGSTVISQLFDSFIVLGSLFWMTGKMTTEVFIARITFGLFCQTYRYRFTLFMGHSIIEKYLTMNNIQTKTKMWLVHPAIYFRTDQDGGTPFMTIPLLSFTTRNFSS
jgi:hypothetical protein